MPYPSTHKPKTRTKILHSAAKLFAWHGFDQISIDAVMADAGLTRGAFYSHFQDKSELYAEAIAYAALTSAIAKLDEELPAGQQVQTLLQAYLSPEHVRQESSPCPLAFLATDVSQRDPQVRHTYTRVYRSLVNRLAKIGENRADRAHRLAATAMMIGGVAIARALDDESTSNELLAACRKFCSELLEHG